MLSPAQIDARRGKLTASRIAPLMTGDSAKIMQLYREMIGEAMPEDLSHVWPVRLGEATESLQLDWYEMKNGCVLAHRGDVIVHPDKRWAAATLDGYHKELGAPVEAKHVGGREPLEVVTDRYQPQMQWQMFVTRSMQCALSVIMGANEPIVEMIERDNDYIDEMVRRGQQFMSCVAARIEPVALDPVAPPADPTKIVNMTGRNEWASSAGIWLDTRNDFERCRDAEKLLKSLVPAEAKRCFGHGIQITRDRAGRLSLREAT